VNDRHRSEQRDSYPGARSRNGRLGIRVPRVHPEAKKKSDDHGQSATRSKHWDCDTLRTRPPMCSREYRLSGGSRHTLSRCRESADLSDSPRKPPPRAFREVEASPYRGQKKYFQTMSRPYDKRRICPQVGQRGDRPPSDIRHTSSIVIRAPTPRGGIACNPAIRGHPTARIEHPADDRTELGTNPWASDNFRSLARNCRRDHPEQCGKRRNFYRVWVRPSNP
jgi:hypothetical protein